jgi:hypothetical protein
MAGSSPAMTSESLVVQLNPIIENKAAGYPPAATTSLREVRPPP